MAWAYYNEHDPFAAQWLRNLIEAGLIPAGEVDERDIRHVRPDELVRFTQCHFFAGIGIWPYALRRAGWADESPIWTGSCPCQPFSTAGAGAGFDDERHLWPHWHWLISQCRPAVVVGEQVASKDGLAWLDLVSADMEGQGFAFGAADLCAAGVGMDWERTRWGQWLQRAIHDCADPVIKRMLGDFAGWAGQGNICDGGRHIRPRIYFVGMDNSFSKRRSEGRGGNHPGDDRQQPRAADQNGGLANGDLDRWSEARGCEPEAGHDGTFGNSSTGGLADRHGLGRYGRDGIARAQPREGQLPEGFRQADRLVNGISAGLEGHSGDGRDRDQSGRVGKAPDGSITPPDVPGNTHPDHLLGADADWLFCRDESWRPVEPSTFPLDNAVAGRVGQLRAYGNALDGETATIWCQTVKELVEGVL